MKKTTTDAWADAHLAGVTQQLAERMAVAAHERMAVARPVASGAGHPDARPAAAADRPSAAGSAAVGPPTQVAEEICTDCPAEHAA